MAEYIDKNKFMEVLECDKYGFTDCAKIGVALDKSTVDIETVKAEAIKEFAERVKKEIACFVPNVDDVREVIDNTAEEMGVEL